MPPICFPLLSLTFRLVLRLMLDSRWISLCLSFVPLRISLILFSILFPGPCYFNRQLAANVENRFVHCIIFASAGGKFDLQDYYSCRAKYQQINILCLTKKCEILKFSLVLSRRRRNRAEFPKVLRLSIFKSESCFLCLPFSAARNVLPPSDSLPPPFLSPDSDTAALLPLFPPQAPFRTFFSFRLHFIFFEPRSNSFQCSATPFAESVVSPGCIQCTHNCRLADFRFLGVQTSSSASLFHFLGREIAAENIRRERK